MHDNGSPVLQIDDIQLHTKSSNSATSVLYWEKDICNIITCIFLLRIVKITKKFNF